MAFTDIEQRILDRLDSFDLKINDLCDRTARVEEKITNHLEHQQQKFNKTTVIIGTMIGIVGLITALK